MFKFSGRPLTSSVIDDLKTTRYKLPPSFAVADALGDSVHHTVNKLVDDLIAIARPPTR
jgi:hypothetical protein